MHKNKPYKTHCTLVVILIKMENKDVIIQQQTWTNLFALCKLLFNQIADTKFFIHLFQ